jgi:hypothetical protein
MKRALAYGACVALWSMGIGGCDGGAVDPTADGGSGMDAPPEADADTRPVDAGSADASGADASGADAGTVELDTGHVTSDASAVDVASTDAGQPACDDADRDGECDGVDATCEADGTRLACRRVAPDCPSGTVPEVRDACYTDRCVTWATCAEIVEPVVCTGDADCPLDRVCRLGVCVAGDCTPRPSVPRDDRYYDRFEGVALANTCARHEDCFVGGCSTEICAAELGGSTCEGLPYGPTGACGCVEGQCVWHTLDCGGGPVTCDTDADRDGTCDVEDSACESDGSTLSCRRLAPFCPEGTVPEVRDRCYTDACVGWTECARLRG